MEELAIPMPYQWNEGGQQRFIQGVSSYVLCDELYGTKAGYPYQLYTYLFGQPPTAIRRIGTPESRLLFKADITFDQLLTTDLKKFGLTRVTHYIKTVLLSKPVMDNNQLTKHDIPIPYSVYTDSTKSVVMAILEGREYLLSNEALISKIDIVSNLENEELVNEITSILIDNLESKDEEEVDSKEETYINMVSESMQGIRINRYKIKHNVDIKAFDESMDLHYGTGFEEFNAGLLHRLDTTDKGIVLLHGEPGTGKTYYIRRLISHLVDNGGDVLYIPPGATNIISNPSFIGVFREWCMPSNRSDARQYDPETNEWFTRSNNKVLLIEDAEELIRASSQRSNGLATILNTADGILNDLFRLKIIATFNMDMGEIDAAILRPERLIARKLFTSIGGERLKKIHEFLELPLDSSRSKSKMTLAEVYATKKSQQTLFHDVSNEEEKLQIGF